MGDVSTPSVTVNVTDPSTSPDRANPGLVVGGRYTLVSVVGHGGMGAVWRATDNHLGREVAVKEVAPPPGISRTERDAMYERMLREARAAAGLSHPSVVQVYDVVTEDGRPWVVMELLDARSLADIVLSDGPLAPRAVAKIGIALLGALEVAHAAGILHRDVKPANVLICTDGRCVLTDFGVARLPTDAGLTTPGMVLGSPHFISPERALGRAFGPASDLFSLGVTLYAAVEGRPPFDKGDPIATMHSIVEDDPAPAQRAGPLREVLHGLLKKDPHHRWDAARARAHLRELLAGPLASAARTFHTDPMAVIPPQRESPPPVYRPQSQVGGRALLPSDGGPLGSPSGPPRPPSSPPVVGGGAAGAEWPDDPYRSVPDPYRQLPDAYRYGEPGRPPPSAGPAPRQRSGPRGQGAAEWSDRFSTASARVSATAGRVAGWVRGLSRPAQAGLAAGVLAVLAAGAVLLTTSGGDRDDTVATGELPSQPSASASPETEAVPSGVQEFAERGITVHLPEDWEEYDRTDIRVDFRDPADHHARIRLLREPSGADAMRFIEIIEPNISCAEPYERVGDITSTEIGGQAAAVLEYRCGTGDDTRHSLWATVVHDGTAYSFFLSVQEHQFEQRRAIFDEMVTSFQFAD